MIKKNSRKRGFFFVGGLENRINRKLQCLQNRQEDRLVDLDHEKRLTEVEQRSKSNTYRLADLEKRQDNLDELIGTVKVLAVREENVENDVKEIKNDVKSLTNKPAQRWESVVSEVIKLLVVAVVGFLLAKAGL